MDVSTVSTGRARLPESIYTNILQRESFHNTPSPQLHTYHTIAVCFPEKIWWQNHPKCYARWVSGALKCPLWLPLKNDHSWHLQKFGWCVFSSQCHYNQPHLQPFVFCGTTSRRHLKAAATPKVSQPPPTPGTRGFTGEPVYTPWNSHFSPLKMDGFPSPESPGFQGAPIFRCVCC